MQDFHSQQDYFHDVYTIVPTISGKIKSADHGVLCNKGFLLFLTKNAANLRIYTVNNMASIIINDVYCVIGFQTVMLYPKKDNLLSLPKV